MAVLLAAGRNVSAAYVEGSETATAVFVQYLIASMRTRTSK